MSTLGKEIDSLENHFVMRRSINSYTSFRHNENRCISLILAFVGLCVCVCMYRRRDFQNDQNKNIPTVIGLVFASTVFEISALWINT